MKDNKVEQSDLIGEIKHFPIEVVQKMIDYQITQGNIANISVFQENPKLISRFGGFDWSDTKEGSVFWTNVIAIYNFKMFFDKYPKQNWTSPLRTKFTRYNNLSKGQLCQMRNQISWIRNNAVLERSLDKRLENIQDDLDDTIEQWPLNQGLINEMYGKKDNR